MLQVEDVESDSSEFLSDSEKVKRMKEANVGRKKKSFESLWKRKAEKSKKDKGLEYTTYRGKGVIVNKKVFNQVSECCTKSCHNNIPAAQQSEFFKSFYECGDKNIQDNIIVSSLIPMAPKKIKPQDQRKYKDRVASWKYQVNINGFRYDCCRSFFEKLIQVSPKRVRIIQNKIIKGEQIVKDMRGKHAVRPNKIQANVWALVDKHWSEIPHHLSHYAHNKSKRLYFENPDLTVKKLFESFQSYFLMNTNTALTMKYKTYHKYFRTNSPYSIRKPRTDVCDFCTQCKILLKANPNDPCLNKYNFHVMKSNRYKDIKNSYLLQAKKENPSVLVLEFDYAQNRPLPKLNATAQFYKRLLWMYIFNIHCHNDQSSVLYWYLENEGTKDSNSVCSLLYHYISRKLDGSSIKKIVLFSDAAGGQNKSVYIVKFLSWLAKSLSLDIEHVYPVRGHSYCVCDRNFGQYSVRMKRVETIETAEEYVQLLKEARPNQPFEVIHVVNILKNWKNMLAPFMQEYPTTMKEKWAIQKYCIIQYNTSGNVQVSQTYQKVFTPFVIIIRGSSFDNMDSLEMDKVELKAAKVKDLRSLMKFVSPNGKQWFENKVFI